MIKCLHILLCFQESLEFKCSTIFQKLPNIKKWLKHVLSLPRIQQTSTSCGFDLVAMSNALLDESSHAGVPLFNIPHVTLDVEEVANDIR